MYIKLNIGDKEVEINLFGVSAKNEEEMAWPEVLDTLVWPALRGWGYIIDNEFTDQIWDLHQEYLNDKLIKKSGKTSKTTKG